MSANPRNAKPRGGNHGAEIERKGNPAYLASLSALYGTPQTINHHDAKVSFIDAMRSAGITPSDPERIVGDGVLHRVHVEGDKSGSHDGWAVLHLDGVPSGAFGHWRTGQQETWCCGGRDRLTPAERIRLDEAVQEARRQREAQRLARAIDAQGKARSMWAQAAQATAHPYLTRKRVDAYGIRQLNHLLVVPLRDADGVLWNLQTIDPNGVKRFLFGGRKRGLYHAIGRAVEDVLCLAEGYATAASVHIATGHPVAVAFDCGNLQSVAKVLRAKYPAASITVCGDNDHQTEGNPGLTAARAAAAAVRGTVALPPEPYNDFNDAMCGSEA